MAVFTTHDAMHAKQLPVLRHCASYEISHSFFLPFQGYGATGLGRTRGVSIDTCADHRCSYYLQQYKCQMQHLQTLQTTSRQCKPSCGIGASGTFM